MRVFFDSATCWAKLADGKARCQARTRRNFGSYPSFSRSVPQQPGLDCFTPTTSCARTPLSPQRVGSQWQDGHSRILWPWWWLSPLRRPSGKPWNGRNGGPAWLSCASIPSGAWPPLSRCLSACPANDERVRPHSSALAGAALKAAVSAAAQRRNWPCWRWRFARVASGWISRPRALNHCRQTFGRQCCPRRASWFRTTISSARRRHSECAGSSSE